MIPSVLVRRLLFGLILAAHAVTMIGAGVLIDQSLLPAEGGTNWPTILVVLAILVTVRAFGLSRLPSVASSAHWLLLKPVVIWEFGGIAGLVGGISMQLPALTGWALLIVAAIVMIALSIVASGHDGVLRRAARPFFLLARGQFDDWSARRLLAGFVSVSFLAAALLTQADRSNPIVGDAPRLFGIGLLVGVLLPFVQMNPIRGLNFFPFGLILLAVASLVHGIVPQAGFPVAMMGFAAGIPIAGMAATLMMLVAPSQRLAAGFLAQGAGVIGGAAGIVLGHTLTSPAGPWILFGITVLFAAAAVRLFFREFVELIMEIVYWPLYRFSARGPGLYHVPTRGPVLIIANHAAYFDPLFLAKVLPLRVRAMMISTMLDKPFLKWLAGDIYGSIRVPDAGAFRRETPELDEAISVLKKGENVMIFPEAWLRRKEEKPIHRFAQGVYRILKELPDTPVLPCWIEDSWGSYLSYKNGPPTKNKKFDVWYRIRMGIGEPIVLTSEQLQSHRETRRYLMELVLAARTHLGLPAHPIPEVSIDEKEDR